MTSLLRRPAVSWLLLAAVSLWLRSFFPVHAIGWAILDDALFIRLARNIGTGHWLGPFTESTLSKGAFYPIFIAASFWAGIPLKLAEHAVYLAASALVAALTPSRAIGTALFVALAFTPVLWAVELARVIREGLYIGLSLGTFGAAAMVATAPTHGAALWRGAVLGLIAGAFWLTREEGVWLLPAVLAILALGAWRSGWRLLIRPIAAATLGWGVLVGGTMAHNWSSYRVAETVDVRSSAFQHAYGAISRIQHERWQHYVVFPADARALAYRISPAARELQPFLDGPGGEAWRQVGCSELPGQDCSEILSPWFQWALRDAVQQAGHYRTARDAARFYKTLAQQIDAACDNKQIPCLPPRSTLAAPFQWSDLADALGPAWSLLTLVSTLGGAEVDSTPSVGSPPDIEAFADLVGPVARKPVEVTDSWQRGRVVLAVTRVIGRCYTLLGPVLLLAGVLGLAVTLVRRRDLVRTPLFALVVGSLIAVSCRIALLAYIDVTAIPSVNLLYLSPAIPFAIVFGVGGTALLIACWRSRVLP